MTESVAFLMADAARLFRRSFDARARCIGLTGQQWRVLAVVARNEGMHQGAAADYLEVEPITLSRMVDRLEESGMIERRPDPADRRARRLFLTERARPLIDQMRLISDSILGDALDGLDAGQRAQLETLVTAVRQNLSRRTEQDDRQSRPAPTAD